MNKELISVIIPAYNLADYIGNTVRCIVNQTYANLEILIVDDGSTDGTVDICRQFAAKDSRIILVENEHKGVSDARNTGLRMAKGEYILFIDGDDLLLSDYVEILFRSLIETGADIAFTQKIDIDEKKINLPINKNTKLNPEYQVVSGYKLMQLLHSSYVYPFVLVTGKLFRRQAIGQTFFKNYQLSEDFEFNSRVYQNVRAVACVNMVGYFKIARNNSLVHSNFSDNNVNEGFCYLEVYRNMAHNELFANLALRTIYHVILRIRQEAPAHYKGKVEKMIREIKDETSEALRNNRYIGWSVRTFILLLVRSPWLYRIFSKIQANTFYRAIRGKFRGNA